jgi:hypothetical protein
MRARMLRSPLWSASLLAGACLVGVVLLLGACASQQVGISAADATLTAAAAPVITVTVTPYATATVLVPPTPTPNATAMAAASLGCRSDSSLYFENPPGPLPTTVPLPPGTLVQNQTLGISGGSAMYYLCTPGATHAAITAYMDDALPAGGWTTTTPPRLSCISGTVVQGQWYKGHYGIYIDFTDSSLPGWAMDITDYTSSCSP